MAVTRAAGVTSKARLSTVMPTGATGCPSTVDTSSAARRSIGMSPPVGQEESTVDIGAAT